VQDLQLLDLNSTMQEIHNMLLRLIGEDIELVFVPGKNLGRVKADPVQIGMVPQGDYVMLAISDSATVSRRSTSRISSSRSIRQRQKAKERASGLPLSMALLSRMAVICVYSEPEFGTTFKIYLPPGSRRKSALYRRLTQ